MTFFEALKANETQRVRQVGDTPGYAPEKLIACLERNMLDIDACNRRAWEVVEEPLEFYSLIDSTGKFLSLNRFECREVALERVDLGTGPTLLGSAKSQARAKR